MLTKLLLTVLVIFGALMALRMRRKQVAPPETRPAATGPTSQGNRLAQLAAYGLVVMALVGAGFFLYLEWQDNYRVISLRVIDSRTGKETRYEVRKGDVDGRRFRTVDGREVTLAEVERLELGGD